MEYGTSFGVNTAVTDSIMHQHSIGLSIPLSHNRRRKRIESKAVNVNSLEKNGC